MQIIKAGTCPSLLRPGFSFIPESLWQASVFDRRELARAGFHEGDQIGDFLFREIEFFHFVGQPRIGCPPLVIMLDGFFQGLQTAVVHVGGGEFNIADGGSFEVPLSFSSPVTTKRPMSGSSASIPIPRL